MLSRQQIDEFIKPLNNNHEFYTVILNSSNTTGTLSSLQYNVDWSNIPDQPYKVTFSYIGIKQDLSSVSSMPVIYINFGVPPNVFEAKAATNLLSSNYLGFVFPSAAANNNYLYVEENSNPPIFLKGRPTSNNLVVNINKSDALTTPFTPTPAAYNLVIKLTPVK